MCEVRTELHTGSLIKLGWVRNGGTYTKGEDKIVYDGTWWWLNGERIKCVEDIEIKLNRIKVKIV